jgi:hypothetical protein
MLVILRRLTNNFKIDWLIDWLRFYVPLKNFSLIWRRHHSRWRAVNFRPMLGAQGRDLYRATPAATRDLGFSFLIRRTAPISRLLRHAWGCGRPILTRILTGFKKPVFVIVCTVTTDNFSALATSAKSSAPAGHDLQWKLNGQGSVATNLVIVQVPFKTIDVCWQSKLLSLHTVNIF